MRTGFERQHASAGLAILDLPNRQTDWHEGGYARVNDAYPFGADYVGRDILSRLLYGARISLRWPLSGRHVDSDRTHRRLYCRSVGGRIDNILMRLVDLMYAFPSILLVILMMAYSDLVSTRARPHLRLYRNKIDSAFGGLFLCLCRHWPHGLDEYGAPDAWSGSLRAGARICAGRAIHRMKQRGILIRHILPNIVGPLIVAETLTIPTYIAFEAFLSFIGLGVNRPTPSWGSMIADGSQAIRSYPNQAIFPALALALAMFAFNFLAMVCVMRSIPGCAALARLLNFTPTTSRVKNCPARAGTARLREATHASHAAIIEYFPVMCLKSSTIGLILSVVVVFLTSGILLRAALPMA